MDFLVEVADCVGRSERRVHLRTYVSGVTTGLLRV